MRDVVDLPEVEFLDVAVDAGDEELPHPAPRRGGTRRWAIASGLATLALAALVVRGVAAHSDRGAAPRTTSGVNSFTVVGPGGVYVEVPYVADRHRMLPGGDAGRMLDCVAGATCVVQRTLPPATVAALGTVFTRLQIESAWSVIVVRPGTRPELQMREIFGLAGSRSVEVEIRLAVASDTAVRIHRAGVEGTRSVFASVTGHYLVQASAFERYESTGGVVDQLGSLVRGGHLMDVR